ncbi:hypothetical protein, partial [Mycobacterium heckeshornense]|uniref:hypothetical protein n=1 Tax=Mycobacterium heckeshornense TaxID=110505 RepID=UPI0021F2582B
MPVLSWQRPKTRVAVWDENRWVPTINVISTDEKTSIQARCRCALTAKSGSVMKIHDRYCQGLSASSGSHRPTVGAEIDSQ